VNDRHKLDVTTKGGPLDGPGHNERIIDWVTAAVEMEIRL